MSVLADDYAGPSNIVDVKSCVLKKSSQELKPSCHIPFLNAVNALRCIMLILTLVWANQHNSSEIKTVNACGNRICKLALINGFS